MQQLIVCEGVSWPNGIRRSGGYIITPSPIIHRADTSPNTGKVIVDYRSKIQHTIDISYQVLTDAEYQSIYTSLKDMVSLQVTYWTILKKYLEQVLSMLQTLCELNQWLHQTREHTKMCL